MKIKVISSFYIVKKGVFDSNAIVEFDDDLAKKIIKQGVAIEYIENSKTIEKEEEIVVEETIDFNDLSVKELKTLLKEKGLSTIGKKKDLIERLKRCDSDD